jgi:hypothetical protein
MNALLRRMTRSGPDAEAALEVGIHARGSATRSDEWRARDTTPEQWSSGSVSSVMKQETNLGGSRRPQDESLFLIALRNGRRTVKGA